MQALLVAGTRSGCGKTSVALGLMAALARRGFAVAPFKSGPDYIDPSFHALACGLSSHNLDPWMCGEAAVRDLFARGLCRAAELAPGRPLIAVVEGAMGLFDGFDAASDAGSAAHLARILSLPVLLVAEAASSARSVLASVLGFPALGPDLDFAGYVLNRVSGESHAGLLRQAFATRPDLPLLGLLPRRETLATPSRHLGLVMPGEDAGVRERIGALADWVEQGMDLDGVLGRLPEREFVEMPGEPEAGLESRAKKNQEINKKINGLVPADVSPDEKPSAASEPIASADACRRVPRRGSPAPGRLIAVARDEAFCFVYAENLRLLEAAGARLAFFSPLRDRALPERTEALYLPGGYPELHAETLAANVSLRAEIRARCLDGLPAWAECGGFMYLCAAIRDAAGAAHPMCGVFGREAVLGTKLAALGYREAETLADTPLGPAGSVARGHEFHYSSLAGDPGPGAVPALRLSSRRGPEPAPSGLVRANTLGAWVHLHLASNPGMARWFAGVGE